MSNPGLVTFRCVTDFFRAIVRREKSVTYHFFRHTGHTKGCIPGPLANRGLHSHFLSVSRIPNRSFKKVANNLGKILFPQIFWKSVVFAERCIFQLASCAERFWRPFSESVQKMLQNGGVESSGACLWPDFGPEKVVS